MGLDDADGFDRVFKQIDIKEEIVETLPGKSKLKSGCCGSRLSILRDFVPSFLL